MKNILFAVIALYAQNALAENVAKDKEKLLKIIVDEKKVRI
jgi:hypothetical protein